jgi:5-formyltetrahydrofolate cyclo-ligase
MSPCFPLSLRVRHSADPQGLLAEKKRLRSAIIAQRDTINGQARRRAAESASRHLGRWLETRRAGLRIGAFVNFGSEIDTAPLLAMLQRSGFVTALPVVVGRGLPLIFRRVRPFEVLETGAYGIPKPGENCPEIEPDIFVVPFAGFDASGYRIGYGGGFYDRTLERARGRSGRHVLAIGYGLGAQEVPQVPREAHDLAMDGMVTERGMGWFPNAGIGPVRWKTS